jgi:small GTP-binding protein
LFFIGIFNGRIIALYKIVVVGGGAVGKSAITVQYISHHFVECYDPTIEDSYKKQKHVDGEVAHIELLDTAGQEEFSCMTEMWLRGADGYLVVFTVTSLASFAEVLPYLERIVRTRDEELSKIPVTIFGNKVDLINEREVAKEEGMKLAEEKSVVYMEGSAKERINIEEAFDGLVRGIKRRREQLMDPEKAKSGKGKRKCTIL